jgi:hypothetical protein
MHVLSPRELEEFVYAEMSQDFSDLDIEIDDFFSDLIKIRHEEKQSFIVLNNFISKTNNVPTDTTLLQSKMSSNPNMPKTESSPQQQSPGKAQTPTIAENHTPAFHPTNLMKKFVDVNEPSHEPSNFLDKPIILKNKETC